MNIAYINKQINLNKGKNLFCKNKGLFTMDQETIDSFRNIEITSVYQKNTIIQYTVNLVLAEFYRVNQYYYFDTKAKATLIKIYTQLFDEIKNGEISVTTISEKHYSNLAQWLKNHNSFSEKLYLTDTEIIQPAACAEYSPVLQQEILQLDPAKMMQPILDIGCGKEGKLVKYFVEQRIDAIGIDRYSFDNPYLVEADWLTYNYGISKWGTIISNLGFSNHFHHHHLREDGDFVTYATQYMNILHSLKVGGSFHYAPDLPFIEQYLGKEFEVRKVRIEELNICASIVTRLI